MLLIVGAVVVDVMGRIYSRITVLNSAPTKNGRSHKRREDREVVAAPIYLQSPDGSHTSPMCECAKIKGSQQLD